MDAKTKPKQKPEIPKLIAALGDADPYKRQHAQILLVHRAPESNPGLLGALKSRNVIIRRGAVKVLGQIRSPEIASALSDMLMDDDIGVRWAASESLIRLGRDSLHPILENFVKNFDSPWLRQGVHHILHVFKDIHQLNNREIALFQELDNHTIPGFASSWTPKQAWAAEKALELLDQEIQ